MGNLENARDLGQGVYTQAEVDSRDTAATYNAVQENRGFKNYIINGGFDVWQRGNGPFTGYNYGPDRWVCANGTHNSSASSSVIGKRMNHIINTTAGGNLLYQAIELNLVGYNAPFTTGKTFTISVYYASTTKIKPSLTFRDGVVGNNPVDIFTTTEYKGGSGNNQVVSWTFAVSATALSTNTCATLSIIGESAATNCYVYNVQLEEGSVATPFEQRPYGLELSLCQRYYQQYIDYSDFMFTTSNSGLCSHTVPLPVKMRVHPSIAYQDLAGNNGKFTVAGNNNISPSAGGLSNSISFAGIDVVFAAYPNSKVQFRAFLNSEL